MKTLQPHSEYTSLTTNPTSLWCYCWFKIKWFSVEKLQLLFCNMICFSFLLHIVKKVKYLSGTRAAVTYVLVKDISTLHAAQVWFRHIHPGRFAPDCSGYLLGTCPLQFSSSATDSQLDWVQDFDWAIMRYISVLVPLWCSFSLVSGNTDLLKKELSPKLCSLAVGLNSFRDACYILESKPLSVITYFRSVLDV